MAGQNVRQAIGFRYFCGPRLRVFVSVKKEQHNSNLFYFERVVHVLIV